MNQPNNIFSRFAERYEKSREVELTLEEYLELCRTDPGAYATPQERMLLAIGEPVLVDTSKDPQLSRIFSNKVLRKYPSFEEFYGMEAVVEEIVAFFRHAAQGLEESKQIPYFLGPVGGGKSSLAERLKTLFEKVPFYAIKGSPLNESPLGLFSLEDDAGWLESEYGIPRRYLGIIPSPWATKRLSEYNGDITRFTVIKLYPSQLEQRAICKTEPGDENNQDISALVGKVDIRKLEEFEQNDPDAYSFSGGLCRGNRGIMEFVEMFKAPIKVLHPLLTATQEKNYKGTEGLSAMPWDGIILAHSNESEWVEFKNNKNNKAFLDRVSVIKVPYCLRYPEEVKIYEKLLAKSALHDAPCAPKTLEIMAQMEILSRLLVPDNSSIYSKMRVYNGENLKDIDPKAKSYQEYKEFAGVNEGMEGLSTRFAFKILSKVFNYDHTEVAANPVYLLDVLSQQITQEQFPAEFQDKLLKYIKEWITPRYIEFIGKEIQMATMGAYPEFGQNIFDRYFTYADFWIDDREFRDPETGRSFNRQLLNTELEKIEKPAGISNPKDFRNEFVNFVLRARAKNGGQNPVWTSYEKMRAVIEKKMFANIEELLPIISFGVHRSEGSEDYKKHTDFVNSMMKNGYTLKQVHILSDWWLQVRKTS